MCHTSQRGPTDPRLGSNARSLALNQWVIGHKQQHQQHRCSKSAAPSVDNEWQQSLGCFLCFVWRWDLGRTTTVACIVLGVGVAILLGHIQSNYTPFLLELYLWHLISLRSGFQLNLSIICWTALFFCIKFKISLIKKKWNFVSNYCFLQNNSKRIQRSIITCSRRKTRLFQNTSSSSYWIPTSIYFVDFCIFEAKTFQIGTASAV